MSHFKNELGLNLSTLFTLRSLFHCDSEEFSISNIDVASSTYIILNQGDMNFILQIKNDDNPKMLQEEELLSSRGDFSLLTSLNNISKLIESEQDKTGLVNKFKTSSNNCFILYTNRGVDKNRFIDNVSGNTPYFLDANTDLYEINFGKLPKGIVVPKNIHSAYLWVNAAGVENIQKEIVEEINKILDHMQLLNFHNVEQELIKFISTDLIQHNYLRKQDIMGKFAELIFSHYQIIFNSQDVSSFYSEQNINIWKEIIHHDIITIIESEEDISRFLFQYIRTEIKKFCNNTDFKSWVQEPLKKQREIDNKISENNLIGFLDLYKLLWINKKLPLLLEVTETEDHNHIQELLKILNFPFKLILMTDAFRIFKKLQDLNEEGIKKLLKLSVRFHKGTSVMENLSEETTFPLIKCKDIIKIFLPVLDIGNQFRLPENLLQRSFSRIFLELRVLDEILDETFLIEDLKYCFNSLIIKNLNISKLGEVNSVKPGIIISDKIVIPQSGLLNSTASAIHHLSIYKGRYLEWKNSFGSIKKIKEFQIELDEIETDLSGNFLKSVTIINGAPGMGKSTLMEFVEKHAPSNKWVLRVDLNRHQEYYKSLHGIHTSPFEHLMYFNKQDPKKELLEKDLKKILQSKDVIVLLDGFDEISVCYKEEVTNIAKSLHEEGYQIWITTRPVMKLYLEETFNTFSVDLKPFTTKDQKYILTKYFGKLVSGSETLILGFVQKLLEMAERNLKNEHAEFLGIPLHIKLLADAFEDECKSYVCCNGAVTVTETFDLLYLYQSYVENRITVLCDKFHALKQSDRIMFKEHQSLFALKLLFPFHDHEEVDKEVEYYRNKPDKLQLLQREGLITIDEKLNVNFTHRTFAEYLAAKWLSENLQNAKAQNLIKERFNKNYKFLFRIFDWLLAKECPLHLSILNNKVEEAKAIIKTNPDSVTWTDKCGRSILHIIALYSVEFPLLFHKYANFYPSSEAMKFLNLKPFEKDGMLEIIEQIPDCKILDIKKDILGYNPLDYALANNSLAAAHKIYEKLEPSTINANINLNFKKSYLGYCTLLNYKSLFTLLLPYFASKDFLFKNVGGNVNVHTYFQSMYSNNAYTKSILNYKIDFGTMTILNLLQSKCAYSGYIKDHYSDLHYAIIFDSITNVEKLLNETTEINIQDQDKNTPLHYTALHGHKQIAKMLLDKNIKVNLQNNSEDTALHIALRVNQLEIADMLLENGANGNIRNKTGETPLHYAVQKNYQDLAKKILSKGGFNDSQNNDGNTPLHLALKKLQFEIASLILSNGADANISNRMGETPLHYSIQNGYNEIAQKILSKGVINNKQNIDGNTPLNLALMNNMIDIAKLLITNGVDVGVINKQGETALHWASTKGCIDIMKVLLSKFTNINKKNKDGCTPLHLALMQEANDAAELLITNGADVNVQNKKFETPLHWASQSGQNKILEKILSKNVLIDKKDCDGNTSLHLALIKNQTHTAELLVSHGADLNIINKKQETLLHCVIQNPESSIIDKLLSKTNLINKQDASGDTPLHLASRKCYQDIVKLLVTHGADLNITNRKCETPLHVLIETEYNGLKEILSNGVRNNHRNSDGNTPLHLALKKNQTEVAQLLISNGASVNEKNNNGENALHCAYKYSCNNLVSSILSKIMYIDDVETLCGNTVLHLALLKRDVKTVEILLASGANVNIVNHRNDTALSYALENGYDGIIVNKMISNSTIDNKWVKDDNTLLHLAVMKGHLEPAELLISYGADINKRNKNHETPLLLAIRYGYLEIAIKVISKNNINIKQRKDGNTPLHWALVRKDIESIKLLLANGASINIGNKKGKTVLHCAAKNGYRDIVKELLLTEGANVNKQSKRGDTPLHLASMKGFTEIVKLLLSNGTVIDLKNKKGKMAIDLARETSNCEVTSLLEKFKRDCNV